MRCSNCENLAREGRELCPSCQVIEDRRIRVIEQKYGLPKGEYNKMLQAQNGACKICKRVGRKMCVDHDHKTREVRGLLCHGCNVGLGRFQDNPQWLADAIEYLATAKTGFFQPMAKTNVTRNNPLPEGFGHCRTCDKIKPLDQFYIRKNNKPYRLCRQCRSERYHTTKK